MPSKINSWNIVILLLLALILGVLIQTAWISDDAYITFRVVENLLGGYGPNFNTGERVEAFTHPLWMFSLAGAYDLLRHLPVINSIGMPLYYLAIFVSLLLAIITVCWLAWKVARSRQAAIFGIVTLTFSRSFIHYSTSGLENPLTNLILIGFLWLFLGSNSDFKKIFLVSLLAGLGLLNRMDTFPLFLPALAYLFFTADDRKKAALAILAGLGPFILWVLFALFYYGFPFPNTAYAKLNTGLGILVTVRNGLLYYVDLWSRDRLTFVAIAAAVATVLASKIRARQMIGLGIVLYCAYILWIGGDFMSGRFFAAPMVLAVGLLVTLEVPRPPVYLWASTAAALIGFTVPYPTVLRSPEVQIAGRDSLVYANEVTDEMAYYYFRTGLLVENKYYIERRFPRPEQWVADASQYQVQMINDLGVKGYSAGPSVHVFDFYALSDPLLARLPSIPDQSTIGHYPRAIPAGYVETLYSSQNQIRNPSLALYYDKLHLVTSGNLFDANRLGEIVSLNLGRYDYLIRKYLQQNQ